MRKILFTLASMAAVAIAQQADECTLACGYSFGKCLSDTYDVKSCIDKTGDCTTECFMQLRPAIFEGADNTTSVQGQHEHHHQHHFDAIKTQETYDMKSNSDYEASKKAASYGDMATCQKDCGIDYAKCMITSLAIIGCAQQEACCALDCLKGVPHVPEHIPTQVKHTPKNVDATAMEVCQENCGISYGQCLIETFDMDACTRAEASCSLGCFKQISVKQTEVMSTAMEICQENCGISYGQCLIESFDMNACTRAEASCSLGCLKQVQTHVNNPYVASLKCSACKLAAGKVEGIINKWGCGLSDVAIGGACEAVFLGPEDPLADICAAGFIAACPTLAKWIEQKTFSNDRACQLIHMC